MKKEKRCKYIRNSLLSAITKVASDPDNCVTRPGRDFTRNRKLPLSTMLQMLIGMGGGSLMKELHEWLGLSAHTASISAFVQQRNKIKPEALECVFHQFLDTVSLPGTYHGYRLLAVDGSDLRLPTNSDDSFSLIQNEEGGKHYNLVHLNAMYDLVNHTYVDAAIQPKKAMNEHAALVSMVDRSQLPGNVIAVMDRGYESFNNIAHFQEKDWKYIIRAKDSYGIITKLKVPNASEFDVDIVLTLTRRQTKETLELLEKFPTQYRWIQPHTTFDYIKPKESKFYDLKFRAVRFQISEETYETVYTNLDANKFPVEKIKELYYRRWGIETSFRELKYAIGLASLHGKKKEFMLQEVFARLVLYNYTSLIAHCVELPEGKRVNFSAAVYFCRQFLKMKISPYIVLENIVKNVSPIRPGRQFQRYQNLISPIGFQYRIS